MNITLTTNLFLLGASILGIWLFKRFPRLTPASIKGAILALVLAWIPFEESDVVLPWVIGQTNVPFALMFVVLPTMTLFFWGVVCFLNVLSAPLQGR